MTVLQRGRQPYPAAQRDGRLHVDGRSRRRLHRPQPSKRGGDPPAAWLDAGEARAVFGDSTQPSRCEAIIANFDSPVRRAPSRGPPLPVSCTWTTEPDINGDWIPSTFPGRSRRANRTTARLSTILVPAVVDSGRAAEARRRPPGEARVLRRRQFLHGLGQCAQSYKVDTSRPPDARRSTASIFHFKW